MPLNRVLAVSCLYFDFPCRTHVIIKANFSLSQNVDFTLEIVGSCVVAICYKIQNVNEPSVCILIGRDCNCYVSQRCPSVWLSACSISFLEILDTLSLCHKEKLVLVNTRSNAIHPCLCMIFDVLFCVLALLISWCTCAECDWLVKF